MIYNKVNVVSHLVLFCFVLFYNIFSRLVPSFFYVVPNRRYRFPVLGVIARLQSFDVPLFFTHDRHRPVGPIFASGGFLSNLNECRTASGNLT